MIVPEAISNQLLAQCFGNPQALNELRVVGCRPAEVLLLQETCAACSRSRARGP